MDKYNQFLPIMKTIYMKLYYLMLGSVYGDVYRKREIVSGQKYSLYMRCQDTLHHVFRKK